MELRNSVYRHKPSHFGTSHRNFFWERMSTRRRRTCGVLAASSRSFFCGGRFCKAKTATYRSWIPFLLSLERRIKPIGPITRLYHSQQEDYNGMIRRQYPLTRSLRLLLKTLYLSFGQFLCLTRTCALPRLSRCHIHISRMIRNRPRKKTWYSRPADTQTSTASLVLHYCTIAFASLYRYSRESCRICRDITC
jgi:hypothetical protein